MIREASPLTAETVSSSGWGQRVTDPTTGFKHDNGKPAVWRALIQAFPNAMMEISRLSTFGASKYSWQNWKNVPDAEARYSDAMMRHLLLEQTEEVDRETGLPHSVSVAWNALARLELFYAKEKDKTTQPAFPAPGVYRDPR